tara:strand:- start:426 stop:1448 length:1023 start_codon:yes stop_codon:yes gene_type:complete
MASFANQFIQGLMNPTYQQGLFTAAQAAGSFPRRQKEAEEKEKKEKGILSGNLAVQQAAQQGQLSSEMLKSYSGNMQNLGMSPEAILKQIKELQKINATAQQQGKKNDYIESLGPEYVALYEASGDFKTVYNQYIEDNKQDSIVALAQQLDPSLSDDLASNMTSSDLVNLYESKKKDKGAQKWAKWQGDNPQITDDNRQQAIEAAVTAHGKDAPKVVADLEAKQLKNRAEKEGDKSVSVLITMKSNSAFSGLDALGGGKTQITVKNLPVNDDGKLSDDAKNWLEAHAASAMVQDTGESWPVVETSTFSTPPEVQGGEGTTLSQLLSPELQKKLINTQMQD